MGRQTRFASVMPWCMLLSSCTLATGSTMYGLPDFTVGGALRQTILIVRRHGGTILTLGLIFYGLPVILLGWAATSGDIPNAKAFQAAAAAHQPLPDLKLFFGFLALNVVVQVAGFILAGAAAIFIAHEGLYGRRATIGATLAAAIRVLPANAVMVMVSGVATALGSLFFIVPGVMLFCRWAVATPVLVVERAGIFGSLGRSRDITSGHRWAILGFVLVVGVIVAALSFAVAFVGTAAGAAAGGTAGVAISAAFGVLANAITVGINGASSAALYFELRRAGEGMFSADVVAAFA